MAVNMQIRGNIIGELSEKIPSNILALNELIKNSYDAGAKKVVIEFNQSLKSLSIQDDGEGMDENDIEKLFHIAESTKKYGEWNEKYQRYTQGSKGLGFLAVFKFGTFVEWQTKKNENIGISFSIDFNQLKDCNDLSTFSVELEKNEEIQNGTKILIQLSTYNSKQLQSYFSDEKYAKKIVGAFTDNSFLIELIIDHQKISSKSVSKSKNILKSQQLFHVKYSSDNNKILFSHNQVEIFSIDYPLNSTNYKLYLDLIIFHLKPFAKSQIDSYFFNDAGDLTPLIFMNDNLFNNFSIFDPNIMRNIRSREVLAQMIGYINIYSDNPMINFNSDRSHFLQNEVTDSVINFLTNLNIKIQEQGSRMKPYLMNFDILKQHALSVDSLPLSDIEVLRPYIKDDFYFKQQVSIVQSGKEARFSFVGKNQFLKLEDIPKPQPSPSEPKPQPRQAEIIVNSRFQTDYQIPSNQINLLEYIKEVISSSGEIIDKSLLEVSIDDMPIMNNNFILPSITRAEQKHIKYCYIDEVTGLATIPDLVLTFSLPQTPIANIGKIQLLSLQTKNKYNVCFISCFDRLITQINKLEIDDYLEVIACSLRTIFELGIDAISHSQKFPTLFSPSDKDLSQKVVKVVSLIRSNKTYLTEIDNNTSIGFSSLKNVLSDEVSFSIAIGSANLGAHKGSQFLTRQQIEDLAKKASIFIVVANEIVNNPNIV